MDRTRLELMAPHIVVERRREAERERALAAAEAAAGGPGPGALGTLGRGLVRLGGRLEARGSVRRAAAPTFVPVPCGGGGN